MTALLVASGLLAIAVALLHGYLGQTRLIAPATFTSRKVRQMMIAMWQLTSAVWIGCGLVIASAPWLVEGRTRSWAVVAACLPLLYGAIGNLWIMRGRHIGGQLMSAAILLALLGVSV